MKNKSNNSFWHIITALNRLTITNHGYSSGEKIVYSTSETVIGGLTSGTEYYVNVVDINTIQLCEVGPTVDPEKNYRQATYVNLTTPYSGIQFQLSRNYRNSCWSDWHWWNYFCR